MPTWDKILDILKNQNSLTFLENYISQLSRQTKRTTICYMSAFSIIKPAVPSPIHSIIDQDMQGFMTCSNSVRKENLDLIIHTPGGDYEATKRIITFLHETFSHIRVFIPHLAMSGGTLIACAANEIYMGPYSSLGPTDPQVFIKGNYIPIGAIISEFELAFNEVSNDPKKALLWNERLKQIPFGILEAVSTMRENSDKYLTELLKKRNCPNISEKNIAKIVDALNSHKKHSSHGKGISLKNAIDLRLNVKDLRKNKELEDLVLSIYHTATIMFQQTTAQKIIANNEGKKFINQYEAKQ